MLMERFCLVRDRIMEIDDEASVPEPYRSWFAGQAGRLAMMSDIMERESGGEGVPSGMTAERYREENQAIYRTFPLGREVSSLRRALLSLENEITRAIPCAYEGRLYELTLVLELFVQIYGLFQGEEPPRASWPEAALASHDFDYCPERTENRLRESLTAQEGRALRLARESTEGGRTFLYRYGVRVTEADEALADVIQGLSEPEAEEMARKYVQGFISASPLDGENAGGGREEGGTVALSYPIGAARIAGLSLPHFVKNGLTPLLPGCLGRMRLPWQEDLGGYYHLEPQKNGVTKLVTLPSLYQTENYRRMYLRSLQTAYDALSPWPERFAGVAAITCRDQKGQEGGEGHPDKKEHLSGPWAAKAYEALFSAEREIGRRSRPRDRGYVNACELC